MSPGINCHYSSQHNTKHTALQSITTIHTEKNRHWIRFPLRLYITFVYCGVYVHVTFYTLHTDLLLILYIKCLNHNKTMFGRGGGDGWHLLLSCIHFWFVSHVQQSVQYIKHSHTGTFPTGVCQFLFSAFLFMLVFFLVDISFLLPDSSVVVCAAHSVYIERKRLRCVKNRDGMEGGRRGNLFCIVYTYMYRYEKFFWIYYLTIVFVFVSHLKREKEKERDSHPHPLIIIFFFVIGIYVRI